MLKIRLMRIGTKKRPFYRVVAVDERQKRTGGYIENLGTYNPLTKPKEIKLNQDRIDFWVKKGAQLSVGFLRIIGKAPQRPPRKPKKAQKSQSEQPEAPLNLSGQAPTPAQTETASQAEQKQETPTPEQAVPEGQAAQSQPNQETDTKPESK